MKLDLYTVRPDVGFETCLYTTSFFSESTTGREARPNAGIQFVVQHIDVFYEKLVFFKRLHKETQGQT